MHKMRTIAIDERRLFVCLSCGFTRLRCANTAEWIEVLLGVETFLDPRSIVLDGSPDFPTDLMRPSPNYFGYLFIFGNICLFADLLADDTCLFC